MIRTAARLLSIAAVALVAGCGRREAVVVYVSADEGVARPILAAFEKETGIAVEPVFDTEATKTTGLAQRLRAERDRPRADLFWSSEIAFTITLAEEGVLAKASGPELDAWPAAWRDADQRWFAFAGRARVIAYAPSRVPADQVPATWMDLAKDRFRGRVAMADPRFGTTRTHMAAARWWWEAHDRHGHFEAWLEGLAENHVQVVTSGTAGVVEAIVNGTADLGMTDSDDVLAAKANGGDVAWVFARHASDPNEQGAGTLLIPNTAGLVQGGPHAEAAAKLLAFLLSPRCEEMLRDSASGNYPLGPGVAPRPSIAEPTDPLVVAWPKAAAGAEAAAAKAIEIVGAPGSHGS